MDEPPDANELRIACDAMCGGLARWLRLLGVDCTYTPGIEDGALVEHAFAEGRLILSSDGRLFDRRRLASGEVAGLRLPVGLTLDQQVRFVLDRVALRSGAPRCTKCNGELGAVGREDVADIVPARTLIWKRDFFRCGRCGHVYWEGSHWRRIRAVVPSPGPIGAQPHFDERSGCQELP